MSRVFDVARASEEGMISAAKEDFKDVTEKVKVTTEQAWDDTLALIRKYPLKAIGIAVATGIVFGASATLLLEKKAKS